MTIYTYRFSKSLAEALNIDFLEVSELSDQNLSEIDHSQFISVPAPHSEETRQAISQSRMGISPSNKGVPNPAQKERFLKNNPMKDPAVAAKVAASKKGKPSPFKITRTFCWSCAWCRKEHTALDNKSNKRKKRQKVFCDKSCAASFSNSNRYIISQPPAAEQASS